MPQPALVGSPGAEATRRFAHRAVQFGVSNRRRDSNCHRLRDLVLYRKDAGEIAVIALRQDMLAALGLDHLCADANPVAGFAQAAFEHIAHTEFAPDLFHVDGPAFVGEAGVAGDHEQ